MAWSKVWDVDVHTRNLRNKKFDIPNRRKGPGLFWFVSCHTIGLIQSVPPALSLSLCRMRRRMTRNQRRRVPSEDAFPRHPGGLLLDVAAAAVVSAPRAATRARYDIVCACRGEKMG